MNTAMLPAHLSADCASCSGLCCVVLPFDAAQGFGFDKAAHVACPHLAANSNCNIHSDLAGQGFSGCAAYDCHGTGQWVTQHLFTGADWRTSAALAEAMFAAFSRYKPIHELMAMLTVALQRAGETAATTPLQQQLDILHDLLGYSLEQLAQEDIAVIRQQTLAMLRVVGQATPIISRRQI